MRHRRKQCRRRSKNELEPRADIPDVGMQQTISLAEFVWGDWTNSVKEEKERGGGCRMVDHAEKGGGWWMRFGVGGDLSKRYRPTSSAM